RLGIDKVGSLTSACTLCGACGEVCPVRIPLPKLINRLRADAVNAIPSDKGVPGTGALRSRSEAVIWKLWQSIYARPLLYRSFKFVATRLRRIKLPLAAGWRRYRPLPTPAPRSLGELARQQGYEDE
ncbi:MAG: DUF3390 domain-containing protein, partial [Candidatus Thiodiazotropha sp. 'RUGA']|nr:DUF3390 domain-containing protein [Candidatus Thiodiazotropha sp. 'RUGA']